MKGERLNPPLLRGKPVSSTLGIETEIGTWYGVPTFLPHLGVTGYRHYPMIVHVDTRKSSLKHFKRVCHALGIAVEKLEHEELRVVRVDDVEGSVAMPQQTPEYVPVRIKCSKFVCYGTELGLEELAKHPSVLESHKCLATPTASVKGSGATGKK